MNNKTNFSRRQFVKQNAIAGVGAAVAMSVAPTMLANCSTDTGTPAILGGTKIKLKSGLSGRYGTLHLMKNR